MMIIMLLWCRTMLWSLIDEVLVEISRVVLLDRLEDM
jgi:hypothetical protein